MHLVSKSPKKCTMWFMGDNVWILLGLTVYCASINSFCKSPQKPCDFFLKLYNNIVKMLEETQWFDLFRKLSNIWIFYVKLQCKNSHNY